MVLLLITLNTSMMNFTSFPSLMKTAIPCSGMSFILMD